MQLTIREAKLRYRTISRGESIPLDTPAAAARYLKGAFDEYIEQEQIFVIPLNRKNHPLGRIRVTVGTAGCALAHSREVYRAAIIAGASAIILAHNHPSGDFMPSRADVKLTASTRRSGYILGVDMLDHIIICPGPDDEDDVIFSFQDNNWGEGIFVNEASAQGRSQITNSLRRVCSE